ncbi:urokinase plasminogen activator surface receptor-like [Tachysurus fulvidraco]|uniref:urokinase plasminogen activator surface receptor-like n=1 Tax=Tachysurus fulvidraco TaxID=1234273 RepID=UPI001FEDE469|nr:urokinase plasminogen activator surface receptor-like [Tachysurus fulvidraco]
MELQLTLILTCLLFSSALGLQCYQCIPDSSGSCESTVTQCPDRCGSITTTNTATTNQDGMLTSVSVKSCLDASQCINGSVRLLNQLTVNVNTKCCSTDLCNTETLPAQTNQISNGRRCYTCAGENCTVDCQGGHCNKTIGTVDCVGDEDRCISITVSEFGVTTSVEGCASKSVCDLIAVQEMMGFGSSVTCCKGNLCNTAEIFTLSFFLLLVPLLSSVLFI